jgi:hypothetical protein
LTTAYIKIGWRLVSTKLSTNVHNDKLFFSFVNEHNIRNVII